MYIHTKLRKLRIVFMFYVRMILVRKSTRISEWRRSNVSLATMFCSVLARILTISTNRSTTTKTLKVHCGRFGIKPDYMYSLSQGSCYSCHVLIKSFASKIFIKGLCCLELLQAGGRNYFCYVHGCRCAKHSTKSGVLGMHGTLNLSLAEGSIFRDQLLG